MTAQSVNFRAQEDRLAEETNKAIAIAEKILGEHTASLWHNGWKYTVIKNKDSDMDLVKAIVAAIIAEKREEIDLVAMAHEANPDYPYDPKHPLPLREAVWGLCQGLEGTGLACDDLHAMIADLQLLVRVMWKERLRFSLTQIAIGDTLVTVETQDGLPVFTDQLRNALKACLP